tara:strand:+ start:484 stop:636 length:153 start_codon:yes stop_codon:yes gene_type:complete
MGASEQGLKNMESQKQMKGVNLQGFGIQQCEDGMSPQLNAGSLMKKNKGK